MLTFIKRLASSVPTPATGKATVFIESTTGEPSFKNDAGVATSLKGSGVPAGGAASQVLAKVDGADYNTAWITPASVSVTYTTSATAALTDAGKFVRMNVAAANTLTVPPNSSVAFPIDTEIHIRQVGAGATTIAAGAGVTLTKPASQSLVLKEQYSVVTLKKEGTDSWAVFGHLT